MRYATDTERRDARRDAILEARQEHCGHGEYQAVRSNRTDAGVA